jgi:hypothetical protein
MGVQALLQPWLVSGLATGCLAKQVRIRICQRRMQFLVLQQLLINWDAATAAGAAASICSAQCAVVSAAKCLFPSCTSALEHQHVR